MKSINENDYLIIKNSTNWASRSISKLRLLFEKVFGDELKSILNKAVSINSEIKDVLDGFVTGSVSGVFGGKSKTEQDHEAITSFIICGNSLNNIETQISSIIIPGLDKLGVVIKKEDISDVKEDKTKKENKSDSKEIKENSGDKGKKKTKPTSKSEIIADLQSKQEDFHNVVPYNELSDEENNKLIEDRNMVMKALEGNIALIESAEDEDYIKKMYSGSVDMYDLFVSTYKNKIHSFSSETYQPIIKSASSAEEVLSYYLISLGEYSKIITPMKEKIFELKTYLGYAGDETVTALRSDCIAYTKLLINRSSKFIDDIEDGIKNKDQKQKWVDIIKSYNEFAKEYNVYKASYVELYSIIKIKAHQDKLKRKRKDKREISDPALKDFVDHSWVDMPARVDKRFPDVLTVRVRR